MALKNPKIAQANQALPANKAFIDALFVEGYNRKATQVELAKFVNRSVKDAANLILGSNSPFATSKKVKVAPLIWPLDKVTITQHFGENPDVYKKFGLKGHDGIDLKTRYIDSPLAHRPVRAAHDGVVQQVRHDKDGYGTHIRLFQEGLGLTIYGHLSSVIVNPGQAIKQGQIIGVTGNTGFSSGPHLHFEFRPDPLKSGNGYAGAADPVAYL